ncbi:MAG TPA: P1 family peptidase [Thermoplasmata archaeon]|nr:P1 family peptidase [Thermoplasmata archaeon]
MVRERGFTSVRGLALGHAEEVGLSSGVTVVRFDTATPTVAEVRGGASATYDTASLALDSTFGRRWAIFLSGGSLYGLDAARGVRARILETGGGHRLFGNPTPIIPVSGAALFDLPRTPGPIPEYLALGYEATRRAGRGPAAAGRVGAGAGATVGKYRGRARCMLGGVGEAVRRWGRGSVGVLAVVNAYGGIRDPATGAWVAGARSSRGAIVPPSPSSSRPARSTGTTLAVVATDLEVSRPVLARVASIVHAGLARAIIPYQSSTDGDVVFASSTGSAGPAPAEVYPGGTADAVGTIAADLAVSAVLSAVRAANGKR